MDPTEHPQPLLRRPWTSLDGTWEFHADPAAVTSDPAVVVWDATIQVPFAPETPASGIAWEGPLRRAWYRRPLPAAIPGERTLLHFGAVDRVADVWVGGVHVASHEGGYTPWSVDVTEQLGGGADLVVRVDDDPHDLCAPRGKQDWKDVPHFIWYPRTTGIWRTVWLEQVAPTRVADVLWTCDVQAFTVTARVLLHGAPQGHRLRLRLAHGDRLLADDTVLVLRSEVGHTFTVGDGTFDDLLLLLWSPATPTLLDATLQLLDADGAVVDEVLSYTALRSVGIEDGQFVLNGRPTPLRLVLDQGYWPGTGATPPDGEALRRDLELTRALGFNGARKHQKTEDPRYHAWADRMGLLVWAEMPSAYAPGPTSAARLLREWADVVQAHRGHPSVVTWVPMNESWGAQGIEGDPRQRALVVSMAAMADALDGTRPVSANDGWQTVGGDVVGVHDYVQDPAVLSARYGTAAAVDATVTTRRADARLGSLDRSPVGARAVVLSEFGGVSTDAQELTKDMDLSRVTGTEPWGYTVATSPDDLLRRYAGLWAAVHASEVLAGACWTQLTDTYQERNGLLHADRSPKADLAALAAATTGRA